MLFLWIANWTSGQDLLFHILSWVYNSLKSSVKLVGAARFLAAGEAIDEDIMLRQAFSTTIMVSIHLLIVLNSSDIFASLSTEHISIDKAVGGNVNFFDMSPKLAMSRT